MISCPNGHGVAMALAAVRCFALAVVALVQLNAEEIPRWTLNLEYDGDVDLEPQAAYDACKAGTCWDSVELRGSLRLDEQHIFRCRAMSHFICSDFCVLST